MTLPKPVSWLIEEFQRLPGIGPKTASRLAYHLLRVPEEQASSLGQVLLGSLPEERHWAAQLAAPEPTNEGEQPINAVIRFSSTSMFTS